MRNELFISEYRHIYNSLNYFKIVNNKLVLDYNNRTYIMPLNNILLYNLSPQLYTLNPIELFQTIYILELLYKFDLNESEYKFINDYVNKYLNLHDLQMGNQINEEERVNALSIPIYTSYSDTFINSKGALFIQDLVNKHTEVVESGKGKGVKLVLTNPNFKGTEEEEFDYNYLEKAGFGTIALISSAILLTALYVLIFIMNH